MKYLGKIGIFMPLSILVLLIVAIGSLIKATFILTFVLAIPLIFIVLWCFPTYLVLVDDFIEVRIGFHRKKIICKDIISLQKTHDPNQDYALSLDRIKIKTGNDSVMVSLRKNDEFIENLLNSYPNIKYIKN